MLQRREWSRCVIFYREQAQQIAALFDHLVGEAKQRDRYGEPKRVGGLEVDGQLVPVRPLDGRLT